MSTAFTLVLALVALLLVGLAAISMAREWKRQRAITRVTVMAAHKLDERCREKTGHGSPQLANIISLAPRRGA